MYIYRARNLRFSIWKIFWMKVLIWNQVLHSWFWLITQQMICFVVVVVVVVFLGKWSCLFYLMRWEFIPFVCIFASSTPGERENQKVFFLLWTWVWPSGSAKQQRNPLFHVCHSTRFFFFFFYTLQRKNEMTRKRAVFGTDNHSVTFVKRKLISNI